MVAMKVVYQGYKHCELTHGPSGSKIATDAPLDNNGKGQAFSPTDLIGASLGSCILTTLAIVADKESWALPLADAEAVVEKIMVGPPRRIGQLNVKLSFKQKISPEDQDRVLLVAQQCPVHRSLHPDLKVNIELV